MSDKQRMTHPDLPGQEIWAGTRTQPSRVAAGWVLDDPAEQAAPSSKAQAKTVAPAATTQEG